MRRARLKDKQERGIGSALDLANQARALLQRKVLAHL